MEKIFKRTATGAIQVWWMQQDGARYRACSGQVGGAVTCSEWTEAKPKNVGRSNATTGEQQALLEVESAYRRKLKDGYSATTDSAEASTRFSPMLAKDFEDYAHTIPYPVWCQPKLDGIRCIANMSGLWSRKGDRIVSCPHIETALTPLFGFMPELILDGELYSHELRDNFNEITSLVKTNKPSEQHLAKTKKIVQYHVYDMVDDRIFDSRLSRLIDVVEEAGLPVVLVPTYSAPNIDELDELYERFLEKGYEGQMVRIDGPYEQKRSKLLLKRKKFVDSEFEVLDILEGVGNASGGAKIAWLRLDTDPNKKFKADVVGTKAQRVAILKNKQALIGKMATVKYFSQRTPGGIPRFGKIKLIHENDRW